MKHLNARVFKPSHIRQGNLSQRLSNLFSSGKTRQCSCKGSRCRRRCGINECNKCDGFNITNDSSMSLMNSYFWFTCGPAFEKII